MGKESTGKTKRIRGLLIISATLVLVGMIAVVALLRNRDDGTTDNVMKSYVYGTMDEYLASPMVSANAGTYSQKLVTVSASPASGGAVTPSTYVVEGSTLTLTAAPASGFKFAGWTDKDGTVVSSSSSFIIPAVTGDVAYTANFTKAHYVVTGKAGILVKNKPEESNTYGVVTGGGVITDASDKVSLTVSEALDEGYAFKGWYYHDGKSTGKTSGTITVGLKGSGADIEINGEDYIEKDIILYGIYGRSVKKASKIVTATMVPSHGHVEIVNGDNMFTHYDGPSVDTRVFTYGLNVPEFSVSWHFREGTTLVPGSTKGETEAIYEFQGVIYEYDKEDGTVVTGYTDDDSISDKGYDGKIGPNTNPKSIELLDYAYSFLNLYIMFKAKEEPSYEQPYSLTTVAYPQDSGSTYGDNSSSNTFSTTVRATPKEGYAFDHWEWVENKTLKKSKENPLYISVTGQITCIAYFTRAVHEVSVASMSPAAGGYVKKGLGSFGHKQDVEVEIVPNEGYEFKNCSYTSNDITYTSESPTFTIPEITEDIFLNINFKQTNFTIGARPEPLGNDSLSYNKVKISSGSTTNETTDTVTSVEMPITSSGDVTLEASANTAAGYKFDKWVGTDGTVSAENPFTPSNISRDVTYIAHFVKEKHTIQVSADPAPNGRAWVYEPSLSSNKAVSLEVETGGEATIEAEETNGYKFLYWTTGTGTKLYEKTVTMTDVRSDETFVAHFTGNIDITVGSSPAGSGKIKFNDEPGVTDTTTYTVKGGSDIILETEPVDPEKYRFVRWQDSSGYTYNSNPVQIVNVTQGDTFTAVYEQIRCTVKVEADPGSGGKVSVNGRPQSDEIDIGGSAELKAEAYDGYTFLYWTSSSGIRMNGETDPAGTNTLSLSNIGSDETFTAHFARKEVNIKAECSPKFLNTGELVGYVNIRGTYNSASTSGITYITVDGGSNVTLTACSEDENRFKFVRWLDSKGQSYSTNPLEIVNVTGDETYYAVMSYVNYGNNITVKASPPEGGTVKKSMDLDGTGTEINASPNDGYEFLYWLSSSGTKLTSAYNVINNVGWDEVYTAYFGKKSVDLTVDVSPAGSGTVKLNDNPAVSGNKVYQVTGGSNVTLTAYSNDENMYRFVKWEDSKGNSYNTNPLELVDVWADEQYTAVFSSTGNVNNITVKASPPEGGRVSKAIQPDGSGTVIKAEANAGYKFLYWMSSSGTKLTDPVSTVKDVGWDEVYTAYFAKEKVKLTLSTSPGNAGEILHDGTVVKGAGTAQAQIEVEGGKDVRLTAVSADDNLYKFTGWKDSRGNSYSANPLELTGVTEDESYTAVFSSIAETNDITVKASPPEGGTVSKRINSDGSTTIIATPNQGYYFMYWMSSAGSKITSGTANITGVGWSEVYTAYFGKSRVSLNIRTMPEGAAEVKAVGTSGGASVSTKASRIDGFSVDGGTNVILTAYSSDENKYRFMKWQDSRGKDYNTNPLELIDVTEDETYTAIFSSEGEVNNITVKASPPEGGTVSKTINGDGTTTIRAEANAGYSFMYWQSSTGTRMLNPTVVLSNVGWDEVFTAYFAQDQVEVTVDIAPSGSGEVEFNGMGYVGSRTTYTVDGGSNIVLSALSNDPERYKFLKWQDSRGNFYNDNPLQIINITASETFTAIFEGIDESLGITVKASPPSGGRVSRKKNSDGTYTISAQANNGYRFTGWKLNDSSLTGSESYTFASYKDGDVYVAYFELDKGYDARTDIAREKLKNVEKIFTAPGYTVTRPSMEGKASAQINIDKSELGNTTPGSREYGAYAKVRLRNEEKYSAADDKSALLIDGELVTTHSEKVDVIAVDHPGAEKMANEFTRDKFGDRYRCEVLTVKKVHAADDFASEKHTFLFRDTGAEHRDNVFILYGQDNSNSTEFDLDRFKNVTCVADEDDVLRFTLPEFTSDDIFIVVRTWPEQMADMGNE